MKIDLLGLIRSKVEFESIAQDIGARKLVFWRTD
jgi:hypothetical protein